MDENVASGIYVLDDERVVLEAIARALQPLGVPVVSSQLWSEVARPLIHSGARPAVLVCDLDLPGISGADFCRIVRRHNPAVKIVIFSGRAADAPRDAADVVVDKKQGVQALSHEVRRLVAIPRARVTPVPGERPSVRRRLLLVEDEPAARRLMRAVLEPAGYAVDEAGDVPTALAMLDRCDVVVSDVRLPGGRSGLEVLAAAKARPSALPVVLVSAFGDAETLRTAIRLHCDEFLDKPVTPEQLVTAVRSAPTRSTGAGQGGARP